MTLKLCDLVNTNAAILTWFWSTFVYVRLAVDSLETWNNHDMLTHIPLACLCLSLVSTFVDRSISGYFTSLFFSYIYSLLIIVLTCSHVYNLLTNYLFCAYVYFWRLLFGWCNYFAYFIFACMLTFSHGILQLYLCTIEFVDRLLSFTAI